MEFHKYLIYMLQVILVLDQVTHICFSIYSNLYSLSISKFGGKLNFE